MSAQTAIRTYDNFIVGNGRFFLSSPYDMDTVDKKFEPADEIEKKMMFEKRVKNRKRAEEAKERDALAIVRYVVTTILKWTPEDAIDHMTPELMKQLHLDMLRKYISVPPNVTKDDCQWIIHKAFPLETSYDEKKQLFEIYNRILSGDLQRFPKGLFNGKDGSYRFGLLLKSYIAQNIPANNIRDLYEIFGDTARGWAILRDAQLFHSARPLYETPLDALHDALGDEGDVYYYNYYQCISVFSAVGREQEKNKKSVKA